MSDLLTSTVHFCTCRSKSRATSITTTTFHQSPPSPTESTSTSTDVSIIYYHIHFTNFVINDNYYYIQKNTNMSYMPWLYEDINKQQAVRLLKENHFGKYIMSFLL